MIFFLIQSLLLLAVAFVIGVTVGAMARMVIATDAPAPTASSSGANSATVSGSSSPPLASPQLAPAADKKPEPTPTPAPPVEAAATAPKVAIKTAQEPKPKQKKPRAAKPKTESAEAGKAKKKAEEKPAPVANEELQGEPDDLKKIKGIGPQNERKLNELGITAYAQIAAWTDKDAEAWGDRLAFPGRIEREDWIAQAKALADAPPTAKPKRKRASAAKTKKA